MTPERAVSRIHSGISVSINSFTGFDIPSAVKCPDGSNMPFTLQSLTSLEKLLFIVAEKLDRYPGLIRLRYRLDTDKPKAGATSIQSNEEFDLFKERMRPLIVPQKLSSGKISTRSLRPVRAIFEDAAEEIITPGRGAHDNKSVGTKVTYHGVLLRIHLKGQ